MYETPDRSVGISGGWFLERARVVSQNGDGWFGPGDVLSRDRFEAVFGNAALRNADEAAGDAAAVEWERNYLDSREED